MRNEWGAKEWFEKQCNPANANGLGDGWGHRWRGLQKFRHSQSLRLIKPIIVRKGRSLTLLDIGCAFGDFTQKVWHLNPANKVHGIDISENAIGVVVRKYPQMEFSIGALPVLNFPDHTFDVVLCLEVLYYLDHSIWQEALASIRRVLKPQGFVLISGPIDSGRRYFDEKELLLLLTSTGMKVKKVQYGYHRLYALMETRIRNLHKRVVLLRELFAMSKSEYEMWRKDKQHSTRLLMVHTLRRIVAKIPLGQRMTSVFLGMCQHMLRYSISAKAVPALFQTATRILIGHRGLTNIMILARVRG